MLAGLMLITLLCPLSQAQTVSLAERTVHLQKRDGFLPYYWDENKGMLLFELSPTALAREFLYFASMGSGVGSIEVFADRGSFSTNALCRFRRVGNRLLVIQENIGFRAEQGGADLKRSVEASFPTSVLAALPIEAEQGGTLLVDANPMLLRDAADLLSQLRRPTRIIGGNMVRDEASGANWKLDEARSVVDLDQGGSFPLNTELEALLTFTTDSEVNLNQPDPHTLSIREHHSFVALPEPGYQPREQDPRVGFQTQSFQDFSQPFDKPLTRYLATRWRLQKKDPAAALSEPVKPLVFYLDRAIPEPVRSAARTGVLWWNAAFEQAGFKNAIRVEDLPAGADPLDVRYSAIVWTNRSGRGWSVGQGHIDPRTGEIIHSVIQLDSHRMRTVGNYWQALTPGRSAEPSLDSFSAFDNMDPKLNSEQVMLARLALLICHEMGHVLGLEHNFVASTYDRGSVMDYFAPRVRLRPDGTADLSDAYMQGTGSYDRFAMEWGYSQSGRDASESARLDAMVKAAIAKGIVWGNYDDPRWNSYDDGPDPVTWLKQVLPVRDGLLAHYGPQMLRPGEPVSSLASRFPLIYLFHRYALAAAVNVVGSAKIPLSLAGDGQQPVVPWPVEGQKEAVRLLLQALQPRELDISPELWRWLAPVENRNEDPERFRSSASYLFSPEDGARAVADIVVDGLLNPRRMQRLEVLAEKSSQALSPSTVISDLVRAGFPGSANTNHVLSGVVQAKIGESLMTLATSPDATPEIQAVALAGVREVQSATRGSAESPGLQWLNHEIELFLRDPQQNTPKPKPSGVPPGPPV